MVFLSHLKSDSLEQLQLLLLYLTLCQFDQIEMLTISRPTWRKLDTSLTPWSEQKGAFVSAYVALGTMKFQNAISVCWSVGPLVHQSRIIELDGLKTRISVPALFSWGSNIVLPVISKRCTMKSAPFNDVSRNLKFSWICIFLQVVNTCRCQWRSYTTPYYFLVHPHKRESIRWSASPSNSRSISVSVHQSVGPSVPWSLRLLHNKNPKSFSNHPLSFLYVSLHRYGNNGQKKPGHC